MKQSHIFSRWKAQICNNFSLLNVLYEYLHFFLRYRDKSATIVSSMSYAQFRNATINSRIMTILTKHIDIMDINQWDCILKRIYIHVKLSICANIPSMLICWFVQINLDIHVRHGLFVWSYHLTWISTLTVGLGKYQKLSRFNMDIQVKCSTDIEQTFRNVRVDEQNLVYT